MDDTGAGAVPLDTAAFVRPQGDEPGFTPSEITAGRLHLRPWLPEDAPQVYAACQDPEIQRWTSVPSPYTEEDARGFVGEYSERSWLTGAGTPFAVLDAVEGQLLASVALVDSSRADLSMAVGYWCAPWARGEGVTTQAVQVVCRWAFATLGIGRIEWSAFVGNDASRRVAEKAGFRHEGVARGLYLHRGQRLDAWRAGLLGTDLR